MIVPFRALAAAFDATANGTVALPWPLDSLPIVSQATSALVVHAHSRPVSMAIVPLPPLDPNVAGELVALMLHFTVLGLEREVEADEQPATNAAYEAITANRRDTERGQSNVVATAARREERPTAD